MNSIVRQKIAMYEAVKAVIMADQNSWNGIPAFSGLVTAYNGKLTLLKQLVLQQDQIVPGVTALKKKVRRKAMEKALIVLGVLKAYALNSDDPLLATKVKLTKSDFLRISDLKFRNLIDELIGLASAALTELADYGIDQSTVTELQSLRDTFEELQGAPRLAIVDRKTTTSNIHLVVKELDELLKTGLDMMMLAFKVNGTNFYDRYTAARIIVDVRGKGSAPTAENDNTDPFAA